MLEIDSLNISTLYLNRDQTHQGRCILAINKHKKELFELTSYELNVFTKDLSLSAKVLKKVFQPQKINYAIYGDIVSHLHVHLVPKYFNGPDWGQAFENSPIQQKFLDVEDYNKLIQKIKKGIKND